MKALIFILHWAHSCSKRLQSSNFSIPYREKQEAESNATPCLIRGAVHLTKEGREGACVELYSTLRSRPRISGEKDQLKHENYFKV